MIDILSQLVANESSEPCDRINTKQGDNKGQEKVADARKKRDYDGVIPPIRLRVAQHVHRHYRLGRQDHHKGIDQASDGQNQPFEATSEHTIEPLVKCGMLKIFKGLLDFWLVLGSGGIVLHTGLASAGAGSDVCVWRENGKAFIIVEGENHPI